MKPKKNISCYKKNIMLKNIEQKIIENFLNSQFINNSPKANVDDETCFVFTTDPQQFLLKNEVQKIYQFNENCPRLIRRFGEHKNHIITSEQMFNIMLPDTFFYRELDIPTAEQMEKNYLLVLKIVYPDKAEIVTKITDDLTDIKYVRIQHSIFSFLCAKMNSFFNRLPAGGGISSQKDFNGVYGGGIWLYDHNTRNIELMEYPLRVENSKNATGENNKRFINENMELIKACIIHFVRIVESQFTDFQFENKYEFTICTRQRRGVSCDFHRDGSDLFLLFIYPKAAATGTYLSFEKMSGQHVNDVDETLKVLPEVNQCDAIMVDNNKIVHATPHANSKSREDLAFIRIAMKKYDETNASTQKKGV